MDSKYMMRAVELSKYGLLSEVAPNPRVGAVLVYRDRIIGEGFHVRSGQAHAEVRCFESVRPQDRALISQSTLYVTLEPCSHYGRTPPCALRILQEGVRRVVVGTLDPSEKVSGRGVSMLRSEGVSVSIGLCEEACREAARFFLTNQTFSRPYVTLKWAESQDGYLDRLRDSPLTPPVLLSSPFTSILMHRERTQYQAILVGRRTLMLDEPSLTARLWSGTSPSPFVLDPEGRTLRLLSSRPDVDRWTVVTTTSVEPHDGVRLWQLPKETFLDSFLSLLHEQGYSSLLVEGGGETLSSFLSSSGRWDEIRREVAPLSLQAGVLAPQIPDSAERIYSQVWEEHAIEYYRNKREGNTLAG